jgi:plasmid stabilization system protein ParE
MVTRIEWTDTAYNHYREIIFYFKQNDARKAAFKFEEDVFNKIDRLKKYPTIGRKSKLFKTMRMINIDDNRQMAYRTKGKTLYICNFWDMRRDIKNRPF